MENVWCTQRKQNCYADPADPTGSHAAISPPGNQEQWLDSADPRTACHRECSHLNPAHFPSVILSPAPAVRQVLDVCKHPVF